MIGGNYLESGTWFVTIEKRMSELYERIDKLDLETKEGRREKQELESLINANAEFFRTLTGTQLQ